MKTALKSVSFACCLSVLTLRPSFSAEPVKEIQIWRGAAPGEKGDIGQEHDITKPSDELIADQ